MDKIKGDLPGWVIEQFREWGKQGGSPRRVKHTGLKGCRCVECREKGKGRPKFGREPKDSAAQ